MPGAGGHTLERFEVWSALQERLVAGRSDAGLLRPQLDFALKAVEVHGQVVADLLAQRGAVLVALGVWLAFDIYSWQAHAGIA
jgi:hypothetical protein